MDWLVGLVYKNRTRIDELIHKTPHILPHTHPNSLLSQFQDMLQRIAQLERWTSGDISTPPCLWLPGLFNPTAFLTAVMQVGACLGWGVYVCI